MERNPPSPMLTRRNEMLADVAAQVERLLCDYDVLPSAANIIGDAISDHLASFWGGQNFTMPMNFHFKRSKVHADIFEAWHRGESFATLAMKYGMTTRGIRMVIARARQQRQGG